MLLPLLGERAGVRASFSSTDSFQVGESSGWVLWATCSGVPIPRINVAHTQATCALLPFSPFLLFSRVVSSPFGRFVTLLINSVLLFPIRVHRCASVVSPVFLLTFSGQPQLC